MGNKALRVILVFSLIWLISCSSSDDSSASQFFNSPKWIQGTWLYIDNDVVVGGFEFTSDNFISILGNYQHTTDFKELLELQAQAGASPNVDETITGTEYSFTLDYGFQSQSFSFYKVSENRIETADGVGRYIKQ